MIEWVIIGGILFMSGSSKKASAGQNFKRFDDLLKKYGTQFGIDFHIMRAFCMKESTFGYHRFVARGLVAPWDIEGSKSEDGKSWGVMQFTLPTARDFDPNATPEKLNNPEYSIRMAAQFIAWIYTQFPANDPRRTEWIVKSYNQGVGRTHQERSKTKAGAADEYFKLWAGFYNESKEGKI